MADIIQIDTVAPDILGVDAAVLTADGQDVAMLDNLMQQPLTDGVGMSLNYMASPNVTSRGTNQNNNTQDPTQAIMQILQSLLQQLQGNSNTDRGGRYDTNNNVNGGGRNNNNNNVHGDGRNDNINGGGRNNNNVNGGGRNNNNVNGGGRNNNNVNGGGRNTPANINTGGYSQVASTTPEVKSAASFAANKLGGTVKSVSNASQQVVAGMNYNMDITFETVNNSV